MAFARVTVKTIAQRIIIYETQYCNATLAGRHRMQRNGPFDLSGGDRKDREIYNQGVDQNLIEVVHTSAKLFSCLQDNQLHHNKQVYTQQRHT